MNNQYQQIQKAAKKTQWLLGWRVIYFIAFTTLFVALSGIAVPMILYQHSVKDAAWMEKIDPRGINENPFSDSQTEMYRWYWFDMTQGNLRYDPVNEQVMLQFMGKKESVPLVSQVGNQQIVQSVFESSYVLNFPAKTQIISDQLERSVQSSISLNSRTQGSYTPVTNADLLAFLMSRGEYYDVDVTVSFKQQKTYSEAKKLLDSSIQILHYNIEIPSVVPGSPYLSQFGFSEEILFGSTTNDQIQEWVEKNVKEGLQFLSRHQKEEDFSQAINGGFLTDNPLDNLHDYDFADLLDYVEYNGVKIESLRVTGKADEIVRWFKEHEKELETIQIHQVKEWDYQKTYNTGS